MEKLILFVHFVLVCLWNDSQTEKISKIRAKEDVGKASRSFFFQFKYDYDN